MVNVTAEESYALKMCFLIDKSKGPRNLILMSWVKKDSRNSDRTLIWHLLMKDSLTRLKEDLGKFYGKPRKGNDKPRDIPLA